MLEFFVRNKGILILDFKIIIKFFIKVPLYNKFCNEFFSMLYHDVFYERWAPSSFNFLTTFTSAVDKVCLTDWKYRRWNHKNIFASCTHHFKLKYLTWTFGIHTSALHLIGPNIKKIWSEIPCQYKPSVTNRVCYFLESVLFDLQLFGHIYQSEDYHPETWSKTR